MVRLASRASRKPVVPGLIAAAALVACGNGAASDGGAPGDLGLPPTAITGTLGDPAGMVSLSSGQWVPDEQCGPRGLRMVFRAGAGDGDGGCGGDGASLALTVYLSDVLPGVYLHTGPVSCRAAADGRGFYATVTGSSGPSGVPGSDAGAGAELVSTGGAVVLGYYDGNIAAGTLDAMLAPPPLMPAPPAPVRLSGSFAPERCP
jgi:hypothetical protein